MTETDRQSDRDLQSQAIELLERSNRSGTPQALRELKLFSAQSAEHLAAMRQARAFVASAKQLERPQKTAAGAWALQMNLWWAQLTERARPVAAFAVTLAAAIFLVFTLHEPAVAPEVAQSAPPVERLTFSSGYRSQKEVLLGDGTTVLLNWNSSITTRFSADQRELVLVRGGAIFNVTEDTGRPFVVRAGEVETLVTGTEFVVGYHPNGIHVGVLEGEVQVSNSAGPAKKLSALQTVSITPGFAAEVMQK
ncbi:MAG: FecR domain-containing protein, partial [Pseudomonadota bacterium]